MYTNAIPYTNQYLISVISNIWSDISGHIEKIIAIYYYSKSVYVYQELSYTSYIPNQIIFLFKGPFSAFKSV